MLKHTRKENLIEDLFLTSYIQLKKRENEFHEAKNTYTHTIGS